MIDLLVVGSGPSGAQCAKAACELGLETVMIDVGIDDPATRERIPDAPFDALRRTDPEQRAYFVGDALADVMGVRVGAQLTPPRQFIVREAERLAPLASATFQPLQSLALGGLGAGWGAGTFTYNDAELAEIGLPAAAMRRGYDEVAADIGISGSAGDDVAAELLRCAPLQPPLPLDDNAAALFATYRRNRARVRARGLDLGRAPSAILTRPIERDGLRREPNPLHDMDFYSDRSRSVYRPRYTVEELCGRANFRYRGDALALRFEQRDDGTVELWYRDLAAGAERSIRARRLALAAGALATTKLVLRSLGLYDRPVPLLSNPYTYLPCVNLAMLGRPAGDARHSMAQLAGVLRRPGNDDRIALSIYSYRSLLLYKLVKEMPLPPELGLLTARLLLSALTIVGMHHPDRRTDAKRIALVRSRTDDVLTADYALNADERAAVAANLRATRAALRALRCIPLGAIDPGNGSSIHYAGGLTITGDARDPLGTSAEGRLHAARSVYVADSANWRFLPAKGLTFSLMANARRVAGAAAAELRAAVTP
ncbi:MAG TPA: hypothetical protein VK665_08260 [Candidatus Elarobacter sp.]|nr:hypothetical protein [Candidatus Elarobacter sp.]